MKKLLIISLLIALVLIAGCTSEYMPVINSGSDNTVTLPTLNAGVEPVITTTPETTEIPVAEETVEVVEATPEPTSGFEPTIPVPETPEVPELPTTVPSVTLLDANTQQV